MTGKVKRSLFAEFLKVGEDYKRIGKGVTEGSISYNPEVGEEQYIDEDNSTKTVDKYAPSISHTATAYVGDPVFDYIDGLRRKRALGSDAETKLLMVYMYTNDDGTGYAAEEQDVSISINEFGGEGGSNVSVTFDINFVGDPVIGTATVADGKVTFTKGA